MKKRVLAFGTFDGIHGGHRFFLSRAAELGDELVVGVARDSHIRELKQREPRIGEQQRLERIADLPMVDNAQLCDEELGTYAIIQRTNPDIIAIGHDQQVLKQSIEEWFLTSGQKRQFHLLPKK